MSFQETIDRIGRKMFEIDKMKVSKFAKENLRRKYFGLKPLTKQQFVKQEKHYTHAAH